MALRLRDGRSVCAALIRASREGKAVDRAATGRHAGHDDVGEDAMLARLGGLSLLLGARAAGARQLAREYQRRRAVRAGLPRLERLAGHAGDRAGDPLARRPLLPLLPRRPRHDAAAGWRLHRRPGAVPAQGLAGRASAAAGQCGGGSCGIPRSGPVSAWNARAGTAIRPRTGRSRRQQPPGTACSSSSVPRTENSPKSITRSSATPFS